MIGLFIVIIHAFGDLEKTEASKLFDKETMLRAPNKFNGNSGIPQFSVKSKSDAVVGEIYSELRYLLSHYFSYFIDNVPEFKAWYNSDYYTMDDDLKKRIVNTLNTNVSSVDSLKSFWENTQGPYLESRVSRVTDRIKILKSLMDLQNPKLNTVRDDLENSYQSAEKRNLFLYEKAIYIVECFKAGLKNHEDKRYPDVFKNFLTAVVEKKSLDNVFSRLVFSV